MQNVDIHDTDCFEPQTNHCSDRTRVVVLGDCSGGLLSLSSVYHGLFYCSTVTLTYLSYLHSTTDCIVLEIEKGLRQLVGAYPRALPSIYI